MDFADVAGEGGKKAGGAALIKYPALQSDSGTERDGTRLSPCPSYR